MPVISSHSIRSEKLRQLRGLFDTLIKKSDVLERLEASMVEEHQSLSAVTTSIQPKLTAMSDDITSLVTDLSGLSVAHKAMIRVGMPSLYEGAQIVAADPINTNFGTIRLRSARETVISPFVGVLADDVLRISSSNDPGIDGAYTVKYAPQLLTGDDEEGRERLSNGDFTDTDTDWTLDPGATEVAFGGPITIVDPEGFEGESVAGDYDGGFLFTGAGGFDSVFQQRADMAHPWEADKPYLVTVKVGLQNEAVPWAGLLLVGRASSPALGSIEAHGVHRFIIEGHGTDGIILTPQSSLDNVYLLGVSVVPWTGIAFTEALSQDITLSEDLVITLEER